MYYVSISKPRKEFNLIQVLNEYVSNLHSCHTVPFQDGAMRTSGDWCPSLSHTEEFSSFWTL